MSYVLRREIRSTEDALEAAEVYARLVAAARDERLWENSLRQDIYLGEPRFIEEVQRRVHASANVEVEVPRAQRRAPRPASEWLEAPCPRSERMRLAHVAGGLSMSEIARSFGLSVSRVSRLIAKAEFERQHRSSERKETSPSSATRLGSAWGAKGKT